ncbi:MAG: oxygenase MpaB family protein [Mycobacterium sp.]
MPLSIPARHPDKPRPVPIGIQMAASALALRQPDADQWRRLGERLNVGDEPMDELVESMSAAGMKQQRPLFDRALAGGIASVPEAPEPLRQFLTAVEARPDWVDADMLRVGQRALRRGGADGMYIARDVALLGGYQFSGFNQTLLRTGALEKGSNQRFAETMRWALDVISVGGLQSQGLGYQSTLRVRLVHALVRRHVTAMSDWDAEEWGVPVNQTDMAATLVGALIAPVVGGLAMGIVMTPRELTCIAHLTRYVGWLIGVQNEWLPRSFRDAIRILFHTSTALSTPDETTRQLSVPMAKDPLAWHYESLVGVRRRLAWAQHLSVTTAFLGPRAMRTLGLPAYMPPWYPMVRIPVNGVRSIAELVTPGGLDRSAERGSREQEALLHTMIGDGPATIGASVAHVRGVA